MQERNGFVLRFMYSEQKEDMILPCIFLISMEDYMWQEIREPYHEIKKGVS